MKKIPQPQNSQISIFSLPTFPHFFHPCWYYDLNFFNKSFSINICRKRMTWSVKGKKSMDVLTSGNNMRVFDFCVKIFFSFFIYSFNFWHLIRIGSRRFDIDDNLMEIYWWVFMILLSLAWFVDFYEWTWYFKQFHFKSLFST